MLIAYLSTPLRALCGVMYVSSRLLFAGPAGGLVLGAVGLGGGVSLTMPVKKIDSKTGRA